KVKLKLTDYDGAPLANGSTVVAVYDKSLEYISGGSNVPDIKEFFWSWKRHHHANTEHSLARSEGNLTLPNKPGMGDLGVFGRTIVEEFADDVPQDEAAAFGGGIGGGGGFGGGRGERQFAALAEADGLALADSAAPGGNAPAAKMLAANADGDRSLRKQAADKGQGGAEGGEFAETAIRSNFADTAFWAAALETDENGHAEVEFDMPENLSAWNIKVWGMGHGTSVGEGAAEVVTRKNLIVRLQAPRFFVETDEVVLSANVHNYLENEKQVQVRLEMEGEHLEALDELVRTVTIPAGGEQRVDWRVKVVKEGEVAITMKALSDEESDAMQMKFPVYVHGMDKMESYSNSLRPEDASGSVEFTIPEKRRIEQTRLEIRYSPTLAGAMVDALPYMVDYPYGCTEQTLNRFVPTVIVQNILQEMNLDLEAIREKQTNLNAQELGDAQQRAQQWKRFDRNPVFSKAEVDKIVRDGVDRLQQMQNSDGGWGWFSGFGEQSYPHTTAVVVHGLQVARQNDVALPAGMLEQGIAWLQAYQAQEVQKIKNAPAKTHPWKPKADNLDAFVFMVLVDGDVQNEEMLEFLYRDRIDLSVYAKAMYGLALHSLKQDEKLDMILDNISQFVVEDDENQTAWLNLPQGYWWYWYGSENEAMAYYLKLLSRTEPKGKRASRLVKYMLNNRKHATYWNSTRDTALCIEAMAEYMRASGESKPNMTVEVWLDGELKQAVEITPETLFQFDNSFVLSGDEIASGKHTVELRKKGEGPLYFNTYVSYFTLEDFITKAGLEIKVERAYYKLEPVEATDKVAGSRGQVIDQKVEKYERVKIENMDEITSGDLVEIELTIDSKNDYEYLLFEDMKAAGFEPVEVRSGYGGNEMGAYMELRDNRVAFFVRQLARGKHSISYRMRAEIPGKFSALPTRASAMYAPELRANSDELKVKIKDAPLQVGAGK
ncbi:MAG: alpha-2-macroglobulin family protein, partial [Pirellulales bacterium]